MMNSSRIYHYLNSNFVATLTIGLTVFLLFFILNTFNLFERFELKAFDVKMTNCAKTLKPDSSIVMAAIDQKSLDFFEDNGVSWPWPREFYGYILNYLKKAGAKAVFFDIDFSSGEIERLETGADESEESFANAIEDFGNVVLSVSLSNSDNAKNNLLPKFFLDEPKGESEFNNVIAPLIEFQKKAKGVGVVNIKLDFDGIVRRTPLFYNVNNHALPIAPFALYSIIKNERIDAKVLPAVADSRKSFLINWYGEGDVAGKTFPYYSIHSLIVSAAKIDENIPPDLPLSTFKNKIVIIGGTAFGLRDYRPVPISSDNAYPGMEIHATVLSNLLQHHFISTPPEWSFYLLILFLSFFSPMLFLKYPQIVSSILIMLASVILLIALNYYLFYFFRINFGIVGPEFALVLSFVLTGYVNYLREGKQKKKIKKIFSRYISPEVVNELVNNYEDVELGGKEVEATIFFSDIKNFTTISEQFEPKDLVKYLNKYLTLLSTVILEEKAMLDKYIGDAIMAIFGTPIKVENPALRACRAALKIQRLLKEEFEKNRNTNIPNFETRIGLNTGKMIVGNIGSTSRTDYTVIGDSVNTASRLEGINKIYGTHIIISESTYDLVRDKMVVRELDKLRVKGKDYPVKIFELIAEKGEETEQILKKIELFENGLELYRKQKWDEAILKFDAVLDIDENDNPSMIFIERCAKFKSEILPEDWDGVFNAITK